MTILSNETPCAVTYNGLLCEFRAGHDGNHRSGYLWWGETLSGSTWSASWLSVEHADVAGLRTELDQLRARAASAESARDEALRQRDALKVFAGIGTWHDECRPNREMAARELAKSQAVIDKMADTVTGLRAQLDAAQAKIAALETQWETHDAEVCPEDVGCVERIKYLDKQLTTAQAALKEMKSALMALPSIIRTSHTEPCDGGTIAPAYFKAADVFALVDAALAAFPPR